MACRPRPRILLRVVLEPLNDTAGALDIRGREPAYQHLRTPTIKHRFENPVFSRQEPNLLSVQKGRNPPGSMFTAKTLRKNVSFNE
ncbi:hypothetical protein J3D46_005088 [Paenarthrobacter sp. A20]|nr:hypothetical protein [Paenarthrobacter sp. A20]